jgi:transcriptional regulator GlxA family with amidase domain
MTYFSKVGPNPSLPKLIGFVAFDGMTTLDLTGPLEAFAIARTDRGQRRTESCYRTAIIGVASKTVVSRSGATFKAQYTLENAPALDTIIIPGGVGLRDAATTQAIAAWLTQHAETTRRVGCISAGIYPVAATGMLDGRSVTTHWRHAGEVVRAFPRLRMNTAAAFVSDQAFYTSSGGTAGIEMSIAMIGEDFGSRAALAVARELVMSVRPAGDERPVDASAYQPGVEERLAELPGWITSRLQENLSVEVLAQRACLCPRHFSRLFKRTFQSTPGDFVEQLRISEAERRLATQRATVESVAAAVGFKSAEVFRRAFERRIGLTPSRYRLRRRR